MQAPVAVCIVSGADYKIELVNERMLQFLGRTPDVVGQPIEQTLTEAKKQGLISILDTVSQTKQPCLQLPSCYIDQWSKRNPSLQFDFQTLFFKTRR